MGNEFRVNIYQNNWQRNSTVTPLRDGGFVVTWTSYYNQYDGSDLSFTYVAAQFYNAAGQRVGGERLIRGVDQSFSGTPQATQLANGNIVITWIESFDHDIISNDTHIKAQIFTPGGQPVGPILHVDGGKGVDYRAPDVTATKDGGFVITYGGEGVGSLGDQVFYRSYSSSGTPRSGEQVLNPNSAKFDELVTHSTTLSNGNSVAIWNSEGAIKDGTDDAQNQLRATLFDGSGRPIRSDFGLTPHQGGVGGVWGSGDDNFGYAVAPRDGGGFAVANLDWTPSNSDAGTQGIYFTTYDASGRPTGRPVPIFERGTVVRDVEMVRLATGQYVVSWHQQSLTASDVGHDAYAIVISADGRPISTVFEIGVDATRYDDQTEISLAPLAGGGFVVTYTSESIDADDEGIAARIYGRGTSGDDRLTVDVSGMLSGLAGNDRLTGNARMNWLWGGEGVDTLIGGAGNDTYITDGRDTIIEGVNAGTDWVQSNVSITLAANTENLRLTGSALIGNGNAANNLMLGTSAGNTLNGGHGNDTINGGGGGDVLNGGTGKDRLDGGSDAVRDVFVFASAGETGIAATRDIVSNFRAGLDDIDLRRIDANTARSGDQAFVFGGTKAVANGVWVVDHGSYRVINGDINGDGKADFQIELVGDFAMGRYDFIL